MLVSIDVAEVMRAPVETIAPTAPVKDAAERLADGLGSLVVQRDGEAVGIVTKTDLVHVLAAGESGLTVADVMSSPLVSIREDDHVEAALSTLSDADVSQVVVLGDDDEVVGVLSTTDLANFFPEFARRHARRTVGARAGERDRHGHVRHPGRVDTAYEENDWSFEYDGGDGIAVGDVARFSKTISEADVEEFAHATGDTNRLHMDESFASGTRFGRRIAHGVLTLGLVSAALARMPGAIVYLSQDCSYLGPVDVGERVTATCEVVEELGGDKYRLDIAATDADGEAVLEGGSTVLVDDIPE